jgi:nucleoside permease NupC
MQLLCAYFVLRLALGQWLFREIAEKVNQFFSYTDLGTSFVYGNQGIPPQFFT